MGLLGYRLERFGDRRAPDDQFLVDLLADHSLGSDNLVGRYACRLQCRAHGRQCLGLAHRLGAILGIVERFERLIKRLRDFGGQPFVRADHIILELTLSRDRLRLDAE